MRPLPLAALLLLAAPVLRAQTRAGVVEAAGPNTASPSVTLSPLMTGGAPQLITLNLAAPSLVGAPGLMPVALAPTPLLAAAPFAPAIAAQSPLPAALPASYISPARTAAIRPAPAPMASAKAVLGDSPQNLEDAPIGNLIEFTKRMFGESSKSDHQSAEYLRPGAPFHFGSAEVYRYRSALIVPRAKSGVEELQTLISAAESLARSAGIAVERGERTRADGFQSPVLKIIPERQGHRLNRLAWDLQKNFDSAVEYAPDRTDGGVAAYNSTQQVLFLPDFGRDDAFEAILHESRHAAFTKRLRRGDLSLFHGSLVAYSGRAIAPHASSYVDYMSFEEISTHAKTVLHDLLRARRDGGAKALSDARADAYQFADVLRSAQINLFQLRRLRGLKSYRLTGETWPVIPGGHWEAVNLPHAIFVVPVLDGPAPPKRGLWSRLFKDDPESTAVLAARRHGDALGPLVTALTAELEVFFDALKGDEADLVKARTSASRMVRLSDQADKLFSAAAKPAP